MKGSEGANGRCARKASERTVFWGIQHSWRSSVLAKGTTDPAEALNGPSSDRKLGASMA